MLRGEETGVHGRYGLLLVTLITVYLISSFAGSRWTAAVQVGLFVAVALLALRTAKLGRRVAKVIAGVVICGSIAAAVLVLTANSVGQGIASLWAGAMLLLTVVIILDRVLRIDGVNAQSIFAALSSYLLIGLMFASFFAAVDHLGAGGFFADGRTADARTFQYFSFTTLTTLGYGDFTAAGNLGRTLAVLEALTGQIFLATLVARLVSAYRMPRRDPPPDD